MIRKYKNNQYINVWLCSLCLCTELTLEVGQTSPALKALSRQGYLHVDADDTFALPVVNAGLHSCSPVTPQINAWFFLCPVTPDMLTTLVRCRATSVNIEKGQWKFLKLQISVQASSPANKCILGGISFKFDFFTGERL